MQEAFFSLLTTKKKMSKLRSTKMSQKQSFPASSELENLVVFGGKEQANRGAAQNLHVMISWRKTEKSSN